MLKIAYPADFLTVEIEQYLIDAEVAVRERAELRATGDLAVSVVAVNAVDLPQLLLDGVFDVAISSHDRVAESELAEQRRLIGDGRAPRRPGSVDRIPVRTNKDAPRLVWGFSATHFVELPMDGSFSPDASLLELARDGREFVANADPGGRVVCVTTHPHTAARELARLGVKAEIREYPDPWRVISPAANFCGLSAWDPTKLSPPAIRLAMHQPVGPAVPVLVSNEVSKRSQVKGPIIERLRNRNRRLRTAQRLSVVRLLIPVERVDDFRKQNGLEHVRVVSRGENAEIVAWVRRELLHDALDRSMELGARNIVELEVERLDLGR